MLYYCISYFSRVGFVSSNAVNAERKSTSNLQPGPACRLPICRCLRVRAIVGPAAPAAGAGWLIFNGEGEKREKKEKKEREKKEKEKERKIIRGHHHL